MGNFGGTPAKSEHKANIYDPSAVKAVLDLATVQVGNVVVLLRMHTADRSSSCYHSAHA